MKRVLLLGLCLGLLASPALAQNGGLLFQCQTPSAHPPTGIVCPVNAANGLPEVPGYATALGYQQITSLSSATSLTVPVGATRAVIVAEAQSVRWRDDGTAPTATIGMIQLTTTNPLAYSGNLAALSFIETTSSAKLDISYYRN